MSLRFARNQMNNVTMCQRTSSADRSTWHKYCLYNLAWLRMIKIIDDILSINLRCQMRPIDRWYHWMARAKLHRKIDLPGLIMIVQVYPHHLLVANNHFDVFVSLLLAQSGSRASPAFACAIVYRPLSVPSWSMTIGNIGCFP
jgi:hypothetical protein